jgi:hypothetical protein
MMSHYEINVALNGKHLFATAPRSLQTEKEARKLYKVFKEKFPKSEGYELRASHSPIISHTVDLES